MTTPAPPPTDEITTREALTILVMVSLAALTWHTVLAVTAAPAVWRSYRDAARDAIIDDLNARTVASFEEPTS